MGKGTKFSVYFPVHHEDPANPARADVAEARPATAWAGGGRILLVEDEDTVRAVAERAVRRGQERIYMENLAKQLRQAQRNVTIFDDSLLDGWTRVKNAAR